jgi:hypothetical protein
MDGPLMSIAFAFFYFIFLACCATGSQARASRKHPAY